MSRMDWDAARRRDMRRSAEAQDRREKRAKARAKTARAYVETPPTDRQLRYLRHLADKTASTFIAPVSAKAASAEIARLIQLSMKKQ